jgi:hypothetical protein
MEPSTITPPDPPPATRYRITVRSDDIELRGYVRGMDNVERLCVAVQDLGAMVLCSLASDDDTSAWRVHP